MPGLASLLFASKKKKKSDLHNIVICIILLSLYRLVDMDIETWILSQALFRGFRQLQNPNDFTYCDYGQSLSL